MTVTDSLDTNWIHRGSEGRGDHEGGIKGSGGGSGIFDRGESGGDKKS